MSEDHGILRPLVFVVLRLLEPLARLVFVFAPMTTFLSTLAADPLVEWSRPRYPPSPWTDLRRAYLDECRGESA